MFGKCCLTLTTTRNYCSLLVFPDQMKKSTFRNALMMGTHWTGTLCLQVLNSFLPKIVGGPKCGGPRSLRTHCPCIVTYLPLIRSNFVRFWKFFFPLKADIRGFGLSLIFTTETGLRPETGLWEKPDFPPSLLRTIQSF